MREKKKKSKKLSDANLAWPPEHLVFFIDRCLGKHIIPQALKEAGESVEVHDDHLPQDAPDQDWFELTGNKGWLAITQDKGFKYRQPMREDIINSGAGIFIFRPKGLTGQEMAKIIVNALPKIKKFAIKKQPPFLAGIMKDGKIIKYEL